MAEPKYWRTSIDINDDLYKKIQQIRAEKIHTGKYADLLQFAVNTILFEQPRYDRIDMLINKIEKVQLDFINNKKEMKDLMMDMILRIAEMNKKITELQELHENKLKIETLI